MFPSGGGEKRDPTYHQKRVRIDIPITQGFRSVAEGLELCASIAKVKIMHCNPHTESDSKLLTSKSDVAARGLMDTCFHQSKSRCISSTSASRA